MSETVNSAVTFALEELNEFRSLPTSLVDYQSNGHVIIIGDSASSAICDNLPEPLVATFLCVSPSPKLKSEVVTIPLNERRIDITGHLGSFVVSLRDASGSIEKLESDLVLDLNTEPVINLEVPPPGYIYADLDTRDSQSIRDELVNMVGKFEKPKYFNYDPNICAHGVNGKTFCTNCIDACPTAAISSLAEKIEVDPYLCQGGGTCATVCPSGAIQYVYPRLTDSGNQIRKMLQSYRQHGGEKAIIVFHSSEEFDTTGLEMESSLLPLKVEEVASVGIDLCLSALVYGASQILLLADNNMPMKSLTALEQQLGHLKAILSGLGFDPAVVSLEKEFKSFIPLDIEWELEPAMYSMPNDKRKAAYQAIDHLYQYGDKPEEMVELPIGAPFGSVMIDETSCTLCMACVGACPGKALQDGSNRETPEVFFIESNCIQCGVCVQTCPENSVSIKPQILFDREKRNRARVLNQDTPFGCISCGKPFASSSVIHKMTDKLKDHYMFQTSRSLDRLKMCEDCRVVDIVQDPNAMSGNFDSLN